MKKQRSKLKAGGLIFGLALFAFLPFFWRHATDRAAENSDLTVVIVQEGREQRLPLGEERILELQSSGGRNVVHLTKDGVEVSEADCRDHICVKAGKIKKTGETIACLPHKLLIYLERN